MSTFRPRYGSRLGIQVRNVRGRYPEVMRVTSRTRVWDGPGTLFTDDIRKAMEKKQAAAKKAATMGTALGRPLGAPPNEDMVRAANLRMQSATRGYRLPQAATTTPMAIRALTLLMGQAAKEAPSQAAQYRKLAAEAAYAYGTYSPFQVLTVARQVVGMGATPRTNEVALQVMKASGAQGSPFRALQDLKQRVQQATQPYLSPKSKTRTSGGSSDAYEKDPGASTTPGFLDQLPAWAPWAALAVGGLLIAGIAFKRRPAPMIVMQPGAGHAS